ncbi:MAG TPA: hypothetical protein PLP07_01825 [Pyrinomonadaceae bacterium]|nr:hypothetical protein [Chloracidobacterium sp.]MBP9934436.1 hypothetical protein [Pyrinomonadaceae bacterium]MBK9437436.1 hypothetical protein [Chloracidobacterium sp.]MBK9766165.1 hypothetical protein [Chloracidobacterium sp.]MBL0240106.1 hypothetical protein [Chloracidobacterium sp.]
MNSKLWIRKATSSCLMIAMLATYSMVALANTEKITGEIIVNGSESALVNGEVAQSGRTIFSASTVSTPNNSSAVINFGVAGAIDLAPNSVAIVSFDDKSATIDLTAGSLTVLRAVDALNVNVAGTSLALNAGERASAQAGRSADDYKDASGKCIDADKDGKEECDSAATWWPWALVMGGAAVGIIWAASQGGNDISLGGGTTVVSPNR